VNAGSAPLFFELSGVSRSGIQPWQAIVDRRLSATLAHDGSGAYNPANLCGSTR
jgi:hypothetical protein